MSANTHKIFDLASMQLQTAVILLIHGEDKFSAITLAGAADVLLSELVRRKGKETFTEALRKAEDDDEARQLSLGEYGNKINDMISINAVKHLDADDDLYVEMDLYQCALTAICKALPNFINLAGSNHKFIDELKKWLPENLDSDVYNVHCDPNWAAKK